MITKEALPIFFDKEIDSLFISKGYEFVVNDSMDFSYISIEQKLKFCFVWDKVFIYGYYEGEFEQQNAYWIIMYEFTLPESFDSFINIVNSYLTTY